jgi:hypothetical protein
MAYINLPPSLQALIDAIVQRLTKLENGQRFTAPNVPVLTTQPTVTGLLSTDPQQPRVGDVWLNTTINTLRYVDTTGAAQAMGGGGGSGTVTSIGAGVGLSSSTTDPIVTSGVLNLEDTAVTAGSYGSLSAVSSFTVDAQGRITAAVNTTIGIGPSQVTGTAITAADTGTVTNTILAGSIANNKLLNSSVTVAGQSVSLGGSTGISLDNLSDVVITTPATDEIIKYNGTSWVNGAAPGGGGGTVTSITAGTNLTGGTITTSGTIALQTSPALSGTPTAPTAAVTVNSTQIATTAFVKSLVPYVTARTGYYDIFPADVTAGTILTKDVMYLMGAVIDTPTLVDSLTIVCSTAGGGTSVTRLGIYDWAGNLVRDAGTVSTSSTGSKTITGLAQTLSPGYYFFAVCGQVATTQPIIRTYAQAVSPYNPAVSISATGANRGISRSATVSGAFPGTLGSSFNDTAQIYRVIYGVA